ncbi:MAG: FTR1 family protein [Anaerolineales bacterium]|jgi:high-affinity iron transporter
MLPSLLLALREGLEAALIIGIVLGALQKIQRSDLKATVWRGVGSAALLSVLTAIALNLVGASLEGTAEEIYEGITMLLAAGVLTWMVFWMQRQAQTIKSELEGDVRRAILQNGGWALFSLAFLAVLREGVELALFLTATTLTSTAQQTLIGALLGLAIAMVLGWLLFASTVKLNLRRFFQVTSALLLLFAAGLVAHGVHEFNEVGWIPPIIEHVWNINPILDENSTIGMLLKALFGYNGNPSLSEVIAYVVYAAAIIITLVRSSTSIPTTREVRQTST